MQASKQTNKNFMDPTGTEVVKVSLFSLRNKNELTSYIISSE